MSSGTYHYREAEQHLEAGCEFHDDGQYNRAAQRIAMAQVHATLALAAATAETARLALPSATPGVKPSAWWTALHGQERS